MPRLRWRKYYPLTLKLSMTRPEKDKKEILLASLRQVTGKSSYKNFSPD